MSPKRPVWDKESAGFRMDQAVDTAADLDASRPPDGNPVPSGRAERPFAPAPEDISQIAALFHTTSDLLAAISLDGHFTLLNPAWEQILGWTREELLSRQMRDLVHPDDVEQTVAVMLAGRDHTAQLANFTNRYRHRDGSWRWLLWSARSDGDTWYAAAKDITDRMWLERQALHDPLTKLPNRLLLMDRARQALTRLHRSHGLVAMLFVDLDRFKAVNDNLGHALGDHLLSSIAERLAMMMRDSDTVARLGGDEFVILAEDLLSDAEALAVAERVLHALKEPFLVGSAEVSMLASVGVSVSHDPEADPESLLREADIAMYRAKRAGGYGLELFDERLRSEMSAHLDIESRLRKALPRGEFAISYQPIVALGDGRCIGCEGLLRWEPHEGQPVEPSSFIPLAEQSGLIVQIGEWVVNRACAQAAAWREANSDIAVSINVSPRGLAEVDLAKRVAAALERHNIPAEALWIEASETAIARDPDRAKVALGELRALGVRVVLDGFGAGESNLLLPATLPLDAVKLDRSLISGMHSDPSKRALAVGIVALAREAGLETIAVGIETEHQLELARELGCSMGQGFLLHAPSSAEQLSLRTAGAIRSPSPWAHLARLRTRH
jgi:diguanylate cyclase (GGDEF)-like protein/PAS domain S-box-containing protein